MGWSRPAQHVLIVAAALLLALSFAAARRAALLPELVPVADDPGIDVRLELNGASIEDLEALPGIGQALAARIVAYRDDHGPFRTTADLANVPGIGGKLAARLHPLLSLDRTP